MQQTDPLQSPSKSADSKLIDKQKQINTLIKIQEKLEAENQRLKSLVEKQNSMLLRMSIQRRKNNEC